MTSSTTRADGVATSSTVRIPRTMAERLAAHPIKIVPGPRVVFSDYREAKTAFWQAAFNWKTGLFITVICGYTVATGLVAPAVAILAAVITIFFQACIFGCVKWFEGCTNSFTGRLDHFNASIDQKIEIGEEIFSEKAAEIENSLYEVLVHVDRIVGHIDASLEKALTHVDKSVAKVNMSLERSFAELHRMLGRVEAILDGRLSHLDAILEGRFGQVDKILEDRLRTLHTELEHAKQAVEETSRNLPGNLLRGVVRGIPTTAVTMMCEIPGVTSVMHRMGDLQSQACAYLSREQLSTEEELPSTSSEPQRSEGPLSALGQRVTGLFGKMFGKVNWEKICYDLYYYEQDSCDDAVHQKTT